MLPNWLSETISHNRLQLLPSTSAVIIYLRIRACSVSVSQTYYSWAEMMCCNSRLGYHTWSWEEICLVPGTKESSGKISFLFFSLRYVLVGIFLLFMVNMLKHFSREEFSPWPVTRCLHHWFKMTKQHHHCHSIFIYWYTALCKKHRQRIISINGMHENITWRTEFRNSMIQWKQATVLCGSSILAGLLD